MLVKALLDQVADMPGKGKLLPIVGFGLGGVSIGLVPLFLTLLCLMVWMPANTRAGTPFLLWAVLLWPLLASLTGLILSEDIVATLKGQLSVFFYLPLAGVAWMTLASFGIAGVVAEQNNR